MAGHHWTSEDIPDQSGRVAVVTGANTGIGYETARALSHKGATVVLACRNGAKAQDALARIHAESPRGTAVFMPLDLASLESVREFADRFDDAYGRLDILVANAGVMMPTQREETAEGLELQMGTNHFGHFALVGRLLDKLLATSGSRVVVVSSMGHRWGRMDFEDVNWARRRYDRVRSYGQSKLANLLFTHELTRRLRERGKTCVVAAAHPGWTATDLQRHTPLFRLVNPYMAMEPWQGALPSLYAATSPDVQGGSYYGPDGCFELRGYPKRVKSSRAAQSTRDASRLWTLSEEATGVRYLSAS
jgi:NAD(P)-dependent dehydrogenase (short-subunit alcohol dehydrogenase family)